MKMIAILLPVLFIVKSLPAQNRDLYRLVSRKPATARQEQTNKPTTTATTNTSQPQPAAVAAGKNLVKNINNGIVFTVDACTGNPQSQTITLYFTFSNPNKSHQDIGLRFRKYGDYTNALDNESKAYPAGEITLGGVSTTGTFNKPTKQLPTGNILKGAITFYNTLPAVTELALVNIYVESCNSSDGGDKKEGLIEVQHVPVTWAAK